jgi:hypothetical protein
MCCGHTLQPALCMKLRIATAAQGVHWVRDGFVAFRQQPIALTSLFFFCFMVLGIVGVVPVIGFALTFGLVPLFSLCMMVGGALTMQGQKPTLPVVLQALRMDAAQRKSFVILGVLFVLGLLLAVGLSTLFDGGEFARMFILGEQIKQETLAQPGVQLSALTMTVMYLALTAVFWHAPGLVYWHRVPAVKALFFSVVACMRNIGAFITYGLVWLAVNVGALIALSLLGGLVGSVAGVAGGAIVLIAGSLMLSVVYFVSVVFSFRDCFDAPEQPATLPTDPAA